MKKFANKLAIAGTLIFGLFLFSCVKEGPQGPAGRNGIVNVDSYSMDVYLADFLFYSTSSEYYIIKNVSYADIQPTDAVLVYLNRETIDNNDYWAQLPFDDFYSSVDCNHFSYELGYNGNMIINIRNSQGYPPYSPMNGTLHFRFIVIRGYLSKKALIPPNLNTNSYSEVVKYYKIDEKIRKM
jgi:hypothetical protein